jgi:recombination protein RecA
MASIPNLGTLERKGPVEVIRNQVEARLPGALSCYSQTAVRTLSGATTIQDVATAGIPQGALTQICTPKVVSAGRSAVLLSLLSELTRQEHFCALVDASDGFDPEAARSALVEMERVLWVRCHDRGLSAYSSGRALPSEDKAFVTSNAALDTADRDARIRGAKAGSESHSPETCSAEMSRAKACIAEAHTARIRTGPCSAEEGVTAQPRKTGTKGKRPLKALEQAFKAADILVQNGGFGLIVVDLSGVEEQHLRKVPLSTWFRFARVVEKMPAALVFLMAYPAAQSCAALTLHVAGAEAFWTTHAGNAHTQLVRGLQCETEIGRTRMRKAVQSARASFKAAAVWG